MLFQHASHFVEEAVAGIYLKGLNLLKRSGSVVVQIDELVALLRILISPYPQFSRFGGTNER